jgi:hypothetical protein
MKLYKVYYHVDSRGSGYIEWNIDECEILEETNEGYILKEKIHAPSYPGPETHTIYSIKQPIAPEMQRGKGPFFKTKDEAENYLRDRVHRDMSRWERELVWNTSWISDAKEILVALGTTSVNILDVIVRERMFNPDDCKMEERGGRYYFIDKETGDVRGIIGKGVNWEEIRNIKVER